jgi:hypothetical protein
MTDIQTPGSGEFRDGAQSPLMPRLPVRGEQHSPADHESTWWQVYDRLGQNHLGPTTC